MRLAYLDCFAGISGDMFLGALIDAGVDPEVLHEATAALDLGASLRIGKVDRSGITATKVDVLEDGRLAEESGSRGNAVGGSHSHEASSHAHAHSHAEDSASHNESDSFREQQRENTSVRQQQPKTQHRHKGGHTHDHGHSPEHSHDHSHDAAGAASTAAPEVHEHHHGRSLTVIRQMIQGSDLAGPVKDFAVRTFELLGASEAKIHNVPVDEIHFHEVGAVDAIVDIVAASAGIYALGMQAVAETGEPMRWHSSALNVGGGMVDCAHGRFPVPAPATADLLRGMPTYSGEIQKELVTPTGAALIRALAPSFGGQPAMRVQTIGYGAGTRNPEGFPNVLRLSIGDAAGAAARVGGSLGAEVQGAAAVHRGTGAAVQDGRQQGSQDGVAGTVTVIETAIDDLSPQVIAHVTERALQLGALDVMSTAVGMKKGRMGTLITILSDDAHAPALEGLLLTETSTLGVRIRQERRSCLERSHSTVDTPFGAIRIKVGTLAGREMNAAPEFEDCRSAALAHGAPVKLVMQAAVAAYATAKAAE